MFDIISKGFGTLLIGSIDERIYLIDEKKVRIESLT
jgi:hypothetical protein